MHINLSLAVSPPHYNSQHKHLLVSFIPFMSFMNERGNGDELNPSYHPPVASKSNCHTMQHKGTNGRLLCFVVQTTGKLFL